jgi:hypothetical protein
MPTKMKRNYTSITSPGHILFNPQHFSFSSNSTFLSPPHQITSTKINIKKNIFSSLDKHKNLPAKSNM